MHNNKLIIEQFKKLIRQIQFDIDVANAKDRVVHMFRLQNIKKVTKIIEQYEKPIKNIDQLKGISGIGKGSLKRIQEILDTGKLSEINEDKINDKYLDYLAELEDVYGIGRRKALELFQKYNIKSVAELKELHKKGKIDLPDVIVKGLKYYGKFKENIPRQEIEQIDDYIHKALLKIDPELFGVICGSYRRLLPKSNDVDLLIVHPSVKTKNDVINSDYLGKIVTYLSNSGFIVESLTGLNVTSKYMGLCQLSSHIRRIDIRFIPYESYYYALFYFTGPKDFNRKVRQLAIDSNYVLNEYGLYDGEKMLKADSEKTIFNYLGLEYVSPEFR